CMPGKARPVPLHGWQRSGGVSIGAWPRPRHQGQSPRRSALRAEGRPRRFGRPLSVPSCIAAGPVVAYADMAAIGTVPRVTPRAAFASRPVRWERWAARLAARCVAAGFGFIARGGVALRPCVAVRGAAGFLPAVPVVLRALVFFAAFLARVGLTATRRPRHQAFALRFARVTARRPTRRTARRGLSLRPSFDAISRPPRLHELRPSWSAAWASSATH